MAKVNIHQAKTQFSSLVQRALSGEEIVVAKAGKALLRLVPIHDHSKTRVLGSDEGKGHIADDFDAPLPDEILRAFEGRRPSRTARHATRRART